MERPIHWGIIGPGKIARKFAADLERTPGGRLHAVASRSEERARAFAEQYGAPHAFGDYRELASCPDLDVVYIASPHSEHAEHALFCLQNGLAVLGEKPLAVNRAQAETLVNAAREHQVFLMEALWSRFIPSLEKTMQLIQTGRIGRVVGVKADFGFRAPFDPESRLWNPALAGGALLDIGIYPFFLAQLILGQHQGMQVAGRLALTGVDEEVAAILTYPGGEIAQLHASLRAHTKTEAFIYGELGTLYLQSRWHHASRLSLLPDGGRPELFHFDLGGYGYNFEIIEVQRCLRDNKLESSHWPWQASLDLLTTLDDVRRQLGVVYPGESI
ncbi:MAG: Gfo/Idh/MocA family oxidoreductase [Lewinellaceae bacterium]|nr:Gfo/Idh/MocA family oxidoreductase [Lewinellaceae bacterium]